MWSQIEPTGTHLTFIFLPLFLMAYCLFSMFIRNKLHLSEPPLATLFGVLIGPYCLKLVEPRVWGLGDNVMIEITRVVVAVSCFVAGIELPRGWMRQHWLSLGLILGPIMVFGWLVCAYFVYALFGLTFTQALIISACLTPTDPVLASSVLGGSDFAKSVPHRIRDLLKAESASNDGISFPFLYVGISILIRSTLAGTIRRWALITVLYQCILGTIVGYVIGKTASTLMSMSERKRFMGPSSYLMFYLLLALFCVGVASTLGLDDFLVAFAAGLAFSHTDSFWKHLDESRLPTVVDVMLNSATFIYFGTDIPWDLFKSDDVLNHAPLRLFALFGLILLFRRIPIALIMKPFVPDIHTWGDALFVGHFGPMGVGALFLALEARAQLETNTSIPLPNVPKPPNGHPDPERQRTIEIIWPIICFVVFGSILVHGLSTLAISTFNLIFQRNKNNEYNAALLDGGSHENYGTERDENQSSVSN